jgi:hypothetical protein
MAKESFHALLPSYRYFLILTKIIMKKEKMSLERMKAALSNVLSREEMKEIMAGSGGGIQCGTCNSGIPGSFPPPCYIQTGGCICSGDFGAGCH